MVAFLVIAVFTLGLIAGSFLNAYTLRLKTGLGVGGRSFCFSCGHPLFWHDLVPLASFLIQKGRCKYCKARLSLQYPMVELFTGIIFVLVVIKLGFFFSLSYFLLSTFYFLIFSILIAIVLYDIRHKIIPNELVYSFIILSFLSIFLIHNSEFIIQNLLVGPLFTIPFVALWFFSKGTVMGFGDAKLVLGIGWFLGLSLGLAAVILSFWIGALCGILLLMLKKSNLLIARLSLFPKRITIKSEVPFAPFLVLGVMLAFFYDISFADIQALFM